MRAAEIDTDDLRANTEYTGYSASSPVVQYFWEVSCHHSPAVPSAFSPDRAAQTGSLFWGSQPAYARTSAHHPSSPLV